MTTHGTLEVLLVGAKSLEDHDFLNSMDPYVLLTCRTQEKRSSTASAQGCDPQWNETFVFTVSDSSIYKELVLRIMDNDTFSQDDFLGQATIPLRPVFLEGKVPPTAYNVVKEDAYCGEIRLGLTFTPEIRTGQQESYGGWKESGDTN